MPETSLRIPPRAATSRSSARFDRLPRMPSARDGFTPAVDVRTFIDARPVSGYPWMVTALCGLIVFVDGFDAQAMGFVAPALSADLQVSRAVLGSVISSGLVGMI